MSPQEQQPNISTKQGNSVNRRTFIKQLLVGTAAAGLHEKFGKPYIEQPTVEKVFDTSEKVERLQALLSGIEKIYRSSESVETAHQKLATKYNKALDFVLADFNAHPELLHAKERAYLSGIKDAYRTGETSAILTGLGSQVVKSLAKQQFKKEDALTPKIEKGLDTLQNITVGMMGAAGAVAEYGGSALDRLKGFDIPKGINASLSDENLEKIKKNMNFDIEILCKEQLANELAKCETKGHYNIIKALTLMCEEGFMNRTPESFDIVEKHGVALARLLVGQKFLKQIIKSTEI